MVQIIDVHQRQQHCRGLWVMAGGLDGWREDAEVGTTPEMSPVSQFKEAKLLQTRLSKIIKPDFTLLLLFW